MEVQDIYRKTEKGTEAIATRGHGVGGKLRMLLILVDGKKTVDDLIKLAAGMGESVQLLLQLEAEGLIERIAGAAPAQASGGGGDLSRVKHLAARLLAELIGPLADAPSLKIEAAKDLPQFIDAMKLAYSVVRDVKGQVAADRFGAEIEAQMPRA